MPRVIHRHAFNGVTAKTGDLLFTQDGDEASRFGQCWKLVGRAFPSEFSHVALYVGPAVRFVESAARGVEIVEFAGDSWDATQYGRERLLVDKLIGIGDPLAGYGMSARREREIRKNVLAYCFQQASEEKPYNFNVFNPDTDGAFYCSQLVYKAYVTQGIDLLRTERRPKARWAASRWLEERWAAIVFPEELWNACTVRELVPAPIS